MLSRFEDTGVLPHSFLAGVTRHGGERGIHILDSAASIGNDDGVGGLLDGCSQACTLDETAFQIHNSPC